MREILFRAKTIATESIWVEGFYNHIPCGRFLCDEHCIQTIEADGRIGQLFVVNDSTVGQFTGLTDKNGKKIFEGDICRVCLDPEICTAHIQYDERTASFNMRYDKYTCNTFLDMRLAENKVGDRVWIEVIGNIHDNPEFLEEKFVTSCD